MNITFKALIKKLTFKSLVSLDKECIITLECNQSDEVYKSLISLHRADKEVEISIKELKD